MLIAHRISGDLSYLQLNKQQVTRTVLVVVLIHVFLGILTIWGLPDFSIKKRPDLTIELGASMPASTASVNSKAVSNNPSKTDKVIETPKKLDKVGEQVVAPKPTAGGASSAASSASMASAPVVDADYKAAYLNNPKPPYPALAYRMRVQGKVILLVEVLQSGQVGGVSIEVSSGNELLDKSALETVKKWQFSPARKDGVIVAQVVKVPISFNLNNK